MIDRLAKLPKNNSFFLFGSRGTGKTTLVKLFLQQFKKTLYIDLLNDELLDRYAQNPQLLKKEIESSDQRYDWIAIDEVQKIPKLLNVVHQLIESKERYKFILTGSSSRKLKQKGVNLLAGRAWVKNIYPLCFQEIKDQFNLSQALNWGTLPQIFSFDQDEDKSDYLKAYSYTYLKTEIQQEQWVRKLEPFRLFLPLAAQMNGQPLNYAKISKQVGVHIASIQNYYEILEETLIGFHLPAYSKSIRQQQRQASKFYFFDLGVKKALQKTLSSQLMPRTSDWGYAFEHFIIAEIYRMNEYSGKDFTLSYLLTKDNFEIDLIIEKPNQQKLFIEIKSANQIFEDDFSTLEKYANEFKCKAIVISNDKINRSKPNISFYHWKTAITKIFNEE